MVEAAVSSATLSVALVSSIYHLKTGHWFFSTRPHAWLGIAYSKTFTTSKTTWERYLCVWSQKLRRVKAQLLNPAPFAKSLSTKQLFESFLVKSVWSSQTHHKMARQINTASCGYPEWPSHKVIFVLFDCIYIELDLECPTKNPLCALTKPL